VRVATVTGRTLGEELRLSGEADRLLAMRDLRSGLEYLRGQSQLAAEGMYLELDAYHCHVFAELRDIVDGDGRWTRLAAWLDGRGVASLDDAMRQLELAPLHDALRTGDAAAALREVAVLLGVPEPDRRGPRGPRDASATEAVEALVAAHRPDLAGGRWIHEWLADRVLPEADLVAVQLERARRPKSAGTDGALPAWLLRDERFRRAIGVNEHDGVEWVSKERWQVAVDHLDVPAVRRRQLLAAAEKAGYRVDALTKALGAQAVKPKRAQPRATSAPTASVKKPRTKPTPRTARAGGGR
jgi:hypothetical protein